MKKRIFVVLAVLLGSCSAAIGVPVLSGPDTIHFDGPPITMTLSGTIDDITGFEGFVWVDYPAFHFPGYIVSPPDEDDFIAAVGGSESYIDLYWWNGPDYQGGPVGFGALPDSGQTIPVGEWFTFDVTRLTGDQPGEKIWVSVISADMYDVLDVHEVTVVVPEPGTVMLLGLCALFVLKRRRT
ncbi:MAG: PEP-CTERM sorting domain-containing protein [Planctomycetota bacterium]